MTDDRLLHPPAVAPDAAPHAAERAPAVLDLQEPDYYPSFEQEEGGIELRRYFLALLRYKWLIIAATIVGGGLGYVAYNNVPVTYMAEANLWIEVDPRPGQRADVTPIRAAGLLQSNAWIELLRSFTVLDSVVVSERLYVNAPDEYWPAFRNLGLMSEFLPGGYELRIGESGEDFVLVTSDGTFVQQGTFGGPVGEAVGFVWSPAPGSFPAGETIQFGVASPRDAATALSESLFAGMDAAGNFLTLRLPGTNPNRLASTLNALMERHVILAADLKKGKLEETLVILEEQLSYTEAQLARAETELEEFRVTTISLPSDRSMPIVSGLEVTRNPVLGNFFDMRVEQEQIRRDRERLQSVLDGMGDGPVRIEALEVIPTAASSSELTRILADLVNAKSELRVLQDRYSDDYGPIRERLTEIESIETQAIPSVVRGLIDELTIRERDMQGYLDVATSDLESIPPRTIEEQRLERAVTATENLHNDIRSRVETARLAAASSIPDVKILDRAAVPQRPTEDKRIQIAMLMFFGCIGAAVAGAILLDRMDARFRYASDVSKGIGLDILGSIPKIETGRSGRKGVENAAQALEAFRELRIHTGFAFGAAGPITLAVTSPSAGEGKSLIASNLAVAFAEVGRRTLLIDADTRRGDAHRLLGRERTPGLIDYLKDRSADDIIQSTDHANLDFIGSGSRGLSTPELLASPRMAYFFGTLKRSYDVIIVDTPPLASGGDPLILGSLTGNVAIVIRTGTTEKQLTLGKLDQLSRLPMRVLGAILNDVSATDAYHTYYASYLPGYEPVEEEEYLEEERGAEVAPIA